MINKLSMHHVVIMLVFIDESGDPGFKLAKGSSPVFVVALVAFRDAEQAILASKAIDGVSKNLRMPTEFKFSKSRPEIRDAFFEVVQPYDFCVRAIVIQKAKLYSSKLREDKTSFYSFFVKSMLKFDNGLLRNAKVIIDGSGDKAFKTELATYLRRNTGEGAVKAVRFSDSRNDRLIQLADMCTGAIARSYRDDRADAQKWRQAISKKIEDVWNFG
ncbi:DUF3800 domain-containing protein [Phyllobacterium sp. K27]